MLAGNSHPGNGGAYFRHTGDSACEVNCQPGTLPSFCDNPSGRGANRHSGYAPAANWYINGRGLSEDILAAAAQGTLAVM